MVLNATSVHTERRDALSKLRDERVARARKADPKAYDAHVKHTNARLAASRKS